jgi:hypothetical protein
MKSTGTTVASTCFAALLAFFVYQWWLNPTRAVQRRLNQIAAALSVPDNEAPLTRVARAAQLRTYLAQDVRVRLGDASEAASREQIVAAVSSFTPPPGGWNIQFVDVRVRVNHDTSADADAYLTLEVNGRDPQTGQPTVDTREAVATLKKVDGEWVVATADLKR